MTRLARAPVASDVTRAGQTRGCLSTLAFRGSVAELHLHLDGHEPARTDELSRGRCIKGISSDQAPRRPSVGTLRSNGNSSRS